MARVKQRDVTIKVQDNSSPSLYVAIGALIDCNIERATPSDDVTTKGSAGHQELFSEGTVIAYSASSNFILYPASGDTQLDDLVASIFNANPQAQLRLTDGIKNYTGLWAIESYSPQGGVAGAARGSVSLRSAGTITVAAV